MSSTLPGYPPPAADVQTRPGVLGPGVVQCKLPFGICRFQHAAQMSELRSPSSMGRSPTAPGDSASGFFAAAGKGRHDLSRGAIDRVEHRKALILWSRMRGCEAAWMRLDAVAQDSGSVKITRQFAKTITATIKASQSPLIGCSSLLVACEDGLWWPVTTRCRHFTPRCD